MSRSKLDRAKRLLDVQNQLLKIEETKAAELKQQKHQLEEAEQDAIHYLDRVDVASRFAALSVRRPYKMRTQITAMEQLIERQKAEVLRKNLNMRLAERLKDTRKREADRDEADLLLKEITEVILVRSRFE